MKTSESTTAVWAAYVASYAECGRLYKDAKNPHFKSRYASLAAVCAVIGDAFAPQGLGIVQTVEDNVLVTRVVHNSGEFFETTCPIVDAGGKSPVHAFGSSLTYSRRYSLMALAGLAPEDDDGGNPNQRITQGPRRRTWNGDRAQFEQALHRMGTTLDAVNDMCQRRNAPPPSALEPARRDEQLRWLHSREGKLALNPAPPEPVAHEWTDEGAAEAFVDVSTMEGPELTRLIGHLGGEAPRYVQERPAVLLRLLRERFATAAEALTWARSAEAKA